MGSTPLGVGAALSSSLPDRLLPRHLLPIRPGIRHRAVLPLFAVTACRRRFYHASRRPLVFSQGTVGRVIAPLLQAASKVNNSLRYINFVKNFKRDFDN